MNLMARFSVCFTTLSLSSTSAELWTAKQIRRNSRFADKRAHKNFFKTHREKTQKKYTKHQHTHFPAFYQHSECLALYGPMNNMRFYQENYKKYNHKLQSQRNSSTCSYTFNFQTVIKVSYCKTLTSLKTNAVLSNRRIFCIQQKDQNTSKNTRF